MSTKLPIFRSVPHEIFVAVSGGVDSVALFHAMRLRRKKVTIVHYNHNCHIGNDERQFVEKLAATFHCDLIVGQLDQPKPKDKSYELFWRENRISFFEKINGLVATGHTLDDSVEWYLMSALNGRGYVPPYQTNNRIKPFIATRKKALIEFCQQHKFEWIDDPTNTDATLGRRNAIRNHLLPVVESIQPGIYSVVSRLIKENARANDN